MAEIGDICLKMAQIIEGVLFPFGPTGPCAIPGLQGACGIYQNWPQPGDIDERVLDGNDVLVAVVDSGQARPMKRYPVRMVHASHTPITLEWVPGATGGAVTLTGEPSTPQNLAVEPGNGEVYAYSVQAADTLQSIVAALAALIPGAVANGETLTVPGATKVIARVGGFSTVVIEKGRQQSIVWVMIFAPTDALRGATVKLIQPVLDDQRRMDGLPDFSTANIFAGSAVRVYDPLKLGLAQTNITYRVEFPVTQVTTVATVIGGKIAAQGGTVPPVSPTDPPPTNVIF